MDRNWVLSNTDRPRGASLSARRAWIEIQKRWTKLWRDAVVALRKESVDRNVLWMAPNLLSRKVALRKESVDRNDLIILLDGIIFLKSLSARRAWIEI